MYTAYKNASVKLELIIIAAPSTMTVTSHTHKHTHTHTHTQYILFCRHYVWQNGRLYLCYLCSVLKTPYVTHLFNMLMGDCYTKALYFQSMPCYHTVTTHHSPLLQQMKIDTSPRGSCRQTYCLGWSCSPTGHTDAYVSQYFYAYWY